MLLCRCLFIGRAISDPLTRQRLCEAAPGAAHVACLATFPADLPGALADRHSDWVYMRFLPSAEEVARCHAVSKQVFLAGTTPALAGRPQDEVWVEAAAAGVDGFLTGWPLELPK